MTPPSEDRMIAIAIEQWHRLHEFAESVINAANRTATAPCWCCGAWLMKPHTPWCGVARNSASRYLVQHG